MPENVSARLCGIAEVTAWLSTASLRMYTTHTLYYKGEVIGFRLFRATGLAFIYIKLAKFKTSNCSGQRSLSSALPVRRTVSQGRGVGAAYNPNGATSRFEMRFAIGSQHLDLSTLGAGSQRPQPKHVSNPDSVIYVCLTPLHLCLILQVRNPQCKSVQYEDLPQVCRLCDLRVHRACLCFVRLNL